MSDTTTCSLPAAVYHDSRQMAALAALDFVEDQLYDLWSLLELIASRPALCAIDDLLGLQGHLEPDVERTATAITAIQTALQDLSFADLHRIEGLPSPVCDVDASVRWFGARLQELGTRLSAR